MTNILLIINSGSSSVKFQIFKNAQDLALLGHGKIYNLGTVPAFSAINTSSPANPTTKQLAKNYSHTQAIHLILDWIKEQQQPWNLSAAAHRIVHGGSLFTKSVIINAGILQQLKQFNSLAPLHQPHNLAAIEILSKISPELPQIGCFDTAFHAKHTPLFTEYALPQEIRAQGVRRYGFHGLSFEWIAHTLTNEHASWGGPKVVVAHLGNGASLCAMNHGLSIDTTMGLTALDGLPMGTRCGSLDPGALIYMIRDLLLSPAAVEQILYNQSGLLGLSGITNDMQELEDSKDEQAQFAIDFFCLKAAQFIAAMTISLGALDGLVFTGGIGENSVTVRRKILDNLQCLQPFPVLVIPANEEKMMALHTLSLLATL